MPESQLHIVLITMDELALGALGSHTPHLQRLAAQSLDFQNAYTASPLCLPSRTTLATGRWPHNHGAVSNNPPSALALGQPNLYTCLQAAGYHTAHVRQVPLSPCALWRDAPRCDTAL